VSGNGLLSASRSRNPFGATTTTRFTAGRYQVTFAGTSVAADPAVLLSVATNSAWRVCAQTVQSLAPVTIQVACWDATGQFADTDFNLAFLR
jgi:hypothetical protein